MMAQREENRSGVCMDRASPEGTSVPARVVNIDTDRIKYYTWIDATLEIGAR